MTCFGCGPANPRGLRLQSYLGDGHVTATFTPWPEHDNGLGFLNGGIIATLRYDDKTRASGHAVWKRWRAR